jgi:hypothetical protein
VDEVGNRASLPITTSPSTRSAGATYLSEFKPTAVKLGYGSYSVGKFQFSTEDPADDIHSGDPIVLHGAEYPRAIFAHAPSRLVYNLDNHHFTEFIATLGMVEKINCGDGVEFVVFGDGKEVFRSKVLRPSSMPMEVQVPIAGVTELTLRVEEGARGDMDCDWAIWGDPRLR